jgi:hypothetical protein
MKRQALFVVLAAVAFLCWLAVPKQSAERMPAAAKTAVHTSGTTSKPDPSTPAPSPPASTATPAGTPAAKPAPQPSPPATAACKLLTVAIARQVIGAGAAPITGKDDSATADIATTTCTYTNGVLGSRNVTVSLITNVALTSLGASENALVFGSDKPSGTADVQGIGQAAYWDPSVGQLNVLSENNWYIIRRDSGSPPASVGESDVDALARLLALRV